MNFIVIFCQKKVDTDVRPSMRKESCQAHGMRTRGTKKEELLRKVFLLEINTFIIQILLFLSVKIEMGRRFEKRQVEDEVLGYEKVEDEVLGLKL